MKKTISLLLALLCAVTTLGGCDKQQNETDPTETNVETVNATEATEPPTEITAPSTEATEPSTQATEPTTQATEPTTQATEPPTEPPTEPLTSAPIQDYTFFYRESALQGQEVKYSIGFRQEIKEPSRILHEEGIKYVTAPIYGGTNVDSRRVIPISAVGTTREFRTAIDFRYADDIISDRMLHNLQEINKYNDDFFKDNMLIIWYGPVEIEAFYKVGTELYIESGTSVRKYYTEEDGIEYGLITSPSGNDTIMCTMLEISKNEIGDIDKISCFVKAQSYYPNE